MKRHILVFLLILFVCGIILEVSSLAHSGRTDKHGGHTNRKTGVYHYHHKK